MALEFAPNGTPLDVLRRNAKAVKKDRDITLSAAQNAVAQDAGFQRWSDLMARKIVVIEDDDLPVLVQTNGPDEITVAIYDLIDEINDMLDAPNIMTIYQNISLEQANDDGVTYHIALSLAPSEQALAPQAFAVLTGDDAENFIDHTDAAADGRYSALIRILSTKGAFETPDASKIFRREFDAALVLALRESGLALGDRYSPVTIDYTAAPPAEFDWNKRCYFHRNARGDITVSNGSEVPQEDLAYRHIPAADWPDVQARLLEACPASRSGSILVENIFHDLLLGDSQACRTIPGVVTA